MNARKGVTGRDAYIIVEALTFTIEALGCLPIKFRPDNNIADMKRLVEHFATGDSDISISQSLVARFNQFERI